MIKRLVVWKLSQQILILATNTARKIFASALDTQMLQISLYLGKEAEVSAFEVSATHYCSLGD